jgi:hypothetical protein
MTRLVQIKKGIVRRVALVEEPHLRLLDGCHSVYELATAAFATNIRLSEAAKQRSTKDRLDYDLVYSGQSEWQLLPPVDHPEPARCLVSGTGLTHLGSARDRQSMHSSAAEELTDSMKMFRWGVEGGRPAAGAIGVAPEWFYKGNGLAVRAHGEALTIPGYAEDGGEEAEMAAVYIVGRDGQPYRVGMAPGNEFADHQFEKRNYLNLAGSKLRACSLGPELTVDPVFESVPGRVGIERSGEVLWSREIATGEREMCHSLRNLEHHHFKFELHRRPGDVHIHFLGAHSLSFGDGVRLRDGDVMEVSFEGFGRALRNPVVVEARAERPVVVRSLG